VLSDGACRPIDPKPPIVVNNDPCAKLSGGDFQRCIRGTPPNNIPIDKIPGKGPVIGGGDVRPIGNPINKPIDKPIDKPIGSLGNGPTGIGSTGNGSTGRIGGTIGQVNPTKPNVILRPQFDGPKNIIRDNGPSNRMPTTSVMTMPKQSVLQPQRQTIIR
jgi:hypothetical protein